MSLKMIEGAGGIFLPIGKKIWKPNQKHWKIILSILAFHPSIYGEAGNSLYQEGCASLSL